MTRCRRFGRPHAGHSPAVSLLDRPDDVQQTRIEELLESGERLLDESRRLLNELNAVDDGTVPRSRRVAET